MIKKLLHIWFSLTILVGMLAGCHDTPQYDSRLTIADSLMKNFNLQILIWKHQKVVKQLVKRE